PQLHHARTLDLADPLLPPGFHYEGRRVPSRASWLISGRSSSLSRGAHRIGGVTRWSSTRRLWTPPTRLRGASSGMVGSAPQTDTSTANTSVRFTTTPSRGEVPTTIPAAATSA